MGLTLFPSGSFSRGLLTRGAASAAGAAAAAAPPRPGRVYTPALNCWQNTAPPFLLS